MIMTDEEMKKTLAQDVIMQSMIGALYKVLTMGEDDTPRGNQDYFSWATPGIPVNETDYDYMFEGFKGKVTKEAVKEYLLGLKESGIDLSDMNEQQVLKEVAMQDVHRKSMAAFDFFKLVDFIPDTSGTAGEGLKVYRVHEQNGSLSEVYLHALMNCSVKRSELDEKTKERIENYRKLMFKTVKKPENLTDEASQTDEKTTNSADSNAESGGSLLDGLDLQSILNDSSNNSESSVSIDGRDMSNYQDWVVTYFEKQAAYLNAVLEDAILRAKSMTGSDQESFFTTQSGGKWVQSLKVKAAKRDWETAGRKQLYERMSDEIALIEKADMVNLVRSYIDTMEEDKLYEPNSKAYYYYTALSPAKFAKSTGWTRFEFDSRETSDVSHDELHNFNSLLNTDFSARKFLTKVNVHTSNGRVDNDSSGEFTHTAKQVKVSFEMCQVNIVRPWFHQSFLTSKFWKFREDGSNSDAGSQSEAGQERHEEMLSDGNIPPTGLLPAYPTTAIFIKNLELEFLDENEFKNFKNEYDKVTQEYGASASKSILGINLGKANVDYNSTDEDRTHDSSHTATFKGQKIFVPGMQIIGFKCHLIGKSPDPDPFIKNWT